MIINIVSALLTYVDAGIYCATLMFTQIQNDLIPIGS